MANHLLMFLGRPSQARVTPVEAAMDELLRVMAASTLSIVKSTALFERLIVVTSDNEFYPPAGVELVRDGPEQEFNFGEALRQVVQTLPATDTVVYVGAGAGVLLTKAEWETLVAALQADPESVTANNFFSADLVGWRPAVALERLAESNQLPDSDNNLAWALCRQAGLKWQPMLPGNSRTVSTIFDVDTPTDVAALKLWFEHLQVDSEVAHFLRKASLFDTGPLDRTLAELSHFEGEVLVIGRVSGSIHRLLELRSHGQTRLISEERGMRASGRDTSGKVNSLAGFLLDELGPVGFFEKLSRLGTAAMIDSRVLFAHRKLSPTRSDRFNSDAFRVDEIVDPEIRAFTLAALEAQTRYGLPVVLGGHSLVSGDLMLLLEMVPPRFG